MRLFAPGNMQIIGSTDTARPVGWPTLLGRALSGAYKIPKLSAVISGITLASACTVGSGAASGYSVKLYDTIDLNTTWSLANDVTCGFQYITTSSLTTLVYSGGACASGIFGAAANSGFYVRLYATATGLRLVVCGCFGTGGATRNVLFFDGTTTDACLPCTMSSTLATPSFTNIAAPNYGAVGVLGTGGSVTVSIDESCA